MHRLGDIRRGEIHHHRAARADVGRAQSLVVEQGLGPRGEGLRQNAEVDESRPGNVGGGHARKIEVADNFLGQRARVLAPLLGQDHRGVALIIAKAQVRCRRHTRGDRLAKCRVQCRGEPRLKLLENRHVVWGKRKSALRCGRLHTGRL